MMITYAPGTANENSTIQSKDSEVKGNH